MILQSVGFSHAACCAIAAFILSVPTGTSLAFSPAMSTVIGNLVTPWATLYGHSTILSTGVMSLHLAGMLLGGGSAIAADRATLRAIRQGAGLRRQLEELDIARGTVIGGLALATLTGLMMFAADFDALVGSPVFWIKLGVLGILVANGWSLVSTARAIRRESSHDPTLYRQLSRTVRLSSLLWLTALILGTALPGA